MHGPADVRPHRQISNIAANLHRIGSPKCCFSKHRKPSHRFTSLQFIAGHRIVCPQHRHRIASHRVTLQTMSSAQLLSFLTGTYTHVLTRTRARTCIASHCLGIASHRIVSEDIQKTSKSHRIATCRRAIASDRIVAPPISYRIAS